MAYYCDLCLEKYDILLCGKCMNDCDAIACPMCKICSILCANKEELINSSIRYRNKIEDYDLKLRELIRKIEIIKRNERLNKHRNKKIQAKNELRKKWEDELLPEFDFTEDQDNWKFVYYL